MRFASLGSGSRGNALIVEVSQTRILLDCGFTLRETIQRLARLGIESDSLNAILVTHEHADHVGGVGVLARKFNLPVWVTHGTYSQANKTLQGLSSVHLFETHQRFSIGEIEISPFPVPHDAREPAQFVFSDGNFQLGVLTDTGCSTPHIESMLSRCHALFLECNHDAEMLQNGPYPSSLKQRVGGRLGHLDNVAAADVLCKLDTSLLQHIVAAHLSEKNNSPELARRALGRAINCSDEWIAVADQECGLAWRSVV
ncbi:MAG: MBL fold metallo-hydrolase [Sulfuricellaceae bacterium]|nr:MBL fold metallo-hydrolase [Sulfuricellaceae bacterium]